MVIIAVHVLVYINQCTSWLRFVVDDRINTYVADIEWYNKSIMLIKICSKYNMLLIYQNQHCWQTYVVDDRITINVADTTKSIMLLMRRFVVYEKSQCCWYCYNSINIKIELQYTYFIHRI